MASHKLPTFFVSHGGGPWPWMTGQMHDAHASLARSLQQTADLVGTRPKAVLMISAHWEEPSFTVMAHPNPPMFYDYKGFPENTYQVQYAAPGAPSLADRVRHLAEAAGIPMNLDAERGFDHGAFVPMFAIYPAADVPLVQLSLKQGLDPLEHLAVGRALASLRDEGVLIIGSGSSGHNVRLLGRPEARELSAAFDDWLQRTLVSASPQDRAIALTSWEEAPAARESHPREEHLLPLMVAVGAAGQDPGACIYSEPAFFGTMTLSNFMFGGAAP